MGIRFGNSHNEVFEQRRQLARNGVLFVTVTVDSSSEMLCKSPKIIFHGFVHMGDGGDLFERAFEKVRVDLERHVASGLEWVQVKAELTETISRFICEETRIQPTVLLKVEQI